MPTHGTAREEVLDLTTRAGGTWWLHILAEQPTSEQDTVELAAVPPVEVPRDSTFWDDAADGSVQPLQAVTMPAATEDTVALGWVLCDDEAGTLPRFSRWFSARPGDPSNGVLREGKQLLLEPEVLELRFTPPAYLYSTS